MACKPSNLLFICISVVLCFSPIAASRSRQSRFTEIGPIVVNVRRAQGTLEYQLNDKHYSKRDLNTQLADMKLDSPPGRRVLVLLDASTYLDDIKLVPKMAIDAGFRDIQVYAVWPDTGTMAEVVFGPVKKISRNPDPHRESAERQ